MNSSLNQSSNSNEDSSVLEFSIRAPKTNRKYNVMRFMTCFGADTSKWKQLKMERENNKTEKVVAEEFPKFGAGSEYRKEEKEEARRKKLGIISKRHSGDDQPWLLRIGGKTGKKFRGVREAGVNMNASFYIFMQGDGNVIEAYPVSEWYNFSPYQRFKTLTAEEAEEEFGKRNRTMAHVSNLMRKKFHKDEDEDLEDEVKKKGVKEKVFKISDMDDWIESDDDNSDDAKDNDDDDFVDKKSKDNKKSTVRPNKKVVNDDESAVEESDDGDEEGRELDYISDSSESVSDAEAKVSKELKGVAEEAALRKLLASDSEEDEEENEEKLSDEIDKADAEEKIDDSSQQSNQNAKKRKWSPNKDSSSDGGGFSSDSESEKNPNNNGEGNNKPPAKKQLLDSSFSESGISEEAVRRYLARKPMTITELLQKFKRPKTNLSSEQLVNAMTQILKKINPVRQTIKDKMYLSVKSEGPSSS